MSNNPMKLFHDSKFIVNTFLENWLDLEFKKEPLCAQGQIITANTVNKIAASKISTQANNTPKTIHNETNKPKVEKRKREPTIEPLNKVAKTAENNKQVAVKNPVLIILES